MDLLPVESVYSLFYLVQQEVYPALESFAGHDIGILRRGRQLVHRLAGVQATLARDARDKGVFWKLIASGGS